MKIVAISMYHLPIPFQGIAYKMAEGRTHSAIDSTVVRIDTDEGVVGWGEICPWGTTYLPEFRDGARAAIAVLASPLIGCDPTNVGSVSAAMERELPGHYYAKSALDLACWDILGKACGRPIYALLGGRLVDSVPLASAVFHGPAEEMMDRIDTRRREGYRRFSIKPSGDAASDIQLYIKIAEQRQDDEIYIGDANGAWSLLAALRVAPELERLGFIIEQPCASYPECLKVRRTTKAAMVLDELLIDNDMLALIAKDNAADVVQLKISRIGGLTVAKRMLDFCLVAGLSVVWATSGGCEISDSAVTHIAAATPEQRLLAVWSCREFTTERFAAGGPLIAEGRAVPPDQPGLGVEPDQDRLGTPIAVFRGP